MHNLWPVLILQCYRKIPSMNCSFSTAAIGAMIKPEVTDRPAEIPSELSARTSLLLPSKIFGKTELKLLETFTMRFMHMVNITMKTGADYIHISSELTFAQYIGGAYFFTTDDPFNPNDQIHFQQFFELGAGNDTNNDQTASCHFSCRMIGV